MRRILSLMALLAVLFALLPFAAPRATAAPAEQQNPAFTFYPDTGHNVGLQIKAYYDSHGGVELLGLPLTELIVDSDGLQVQYFERVRFEFRPDAEPNARVVLSRLGAQLSEGRTEPEFAWLAGSPDPSRQFFPESGHTIGGAFAWFWQTNGAVEIFGFPVSEELLERNSLDGKEYLVQYFERARFEYHPELAGQPGEVALSALGREFLLRDPLALAASAPVKPLELLGQASTGFAASATDRITNITRATAMVDGFVVPSGAEFSFISVGDFSAENGFVDGYGIVGGRLEKVIGGGLCQVSTTLFRAVSNAGLQITRRVGHSHIVNFYENILGFDATVFVPGVDFRWRNDSPGTVYIIGKVDRAATKMTFEIWGLNDGRTVSYEGPFTKNWTQPGVPVWQYDKTLPYGAVRQLVHGRSGVDVNYYRDIRAADGTTKRTNYFTRYTPWEDFYIYGPGVTPPDGVKIIAPKS